LRSPSRSQMLYLGYFAALGAVTPFMVLFLDQRGMSATEIGMLASAAAGAAILPGILWAAWSDRLDRRRPFLVLAFVVQIVVWLLFPAASGFLQFLALYLALSILKPPAEGLMNVLVLGRLRTSFRGAGYSKVRIFGSIGWIISTVAVGTLIPEQRLSLIFLVGSALMAVCVLLPPSGSEDSNPVGGIVRPDARMRLIFPFAAATVTRAISMGMAYTFLSIYLKGIGTPLSLIGSAWAISAVPEIPMMIFAGRLSDRIGNVPLLISGFLVSALMAGAYSVIDDPVIAVPLTALSGVSFSLTYISSVNYLASVTSRGKQATAQSTYIVLSSQLPRAAGPFIGGLVIDLYGIGSMFAMAAVLCLGGTAMLLPLLRHRGKSRSHVTT